MKGWSQTILLANVYCQCGWGIKDTNLDYIRGIAEATDNGHRCVIASGDWNIVADELESSGILEGLGLELVRPSNSDFVCAASKRGALIDYLITTKGYRSFIRPCEVVREVPLRHTPRSPHDTCRQPFRDRS